MRKFLSRLLFSLGERMYTMAVRLESDNKAEEKIMRYPECLMINSKAQAMKNLSDRLEDYIEGKKLYLDPYLNLSRVASLVGSNRTYISNILASRNGFKNYLNELRFRHIFQQISALPNNQSGIIREGRDREDSADYSFIILRSGFSDLRTFRRQLSLIKGEWASRLRSILY